MTQESESFSELVLREALDDDAALADYLARFPEHFDRLERLFQVHEALPQESPLAAEGVDTEKLADAPTDPFATLPGDTTKVAALQSVGRLADYELLEEIARGGMGVVYKAWQRGADRVVALKMILAGRFASETEVQRFRTEAQAAARLDHANIVPLFAVGEHDQHHYFSMAYVEGESLAQRVARGPLDPSEASRLVRDLANAVHYAHQRGIAHRDLKPANILLTSEGVPKITDFGLAKRLEADGPTVTGDILGTPSYMAPEHAKGVAGQAETLGDTYSLGAILYCLLTGRPPFQAATVVDTLAQVVADDPVSPRQLNGAIDRDLQTICLKCLEKEPTRRYASSADLADDLDRYLNGEPIRARSISRVERLWRWCRRRPLVATLTSVSTILAVGLVAALAGGYVHQANLRRDAEGARQLADEHANTARRQADLALDTLERVVFDIQRKLEHVPAAQQVRREMLVSVIGQLDRVAGNLATHDWADHHTAVAHIELGDIFLAVAAAGDTTGIGRAQHEYEMANHAFQQMHKEDPENTFIQHNLAISYGKLATIEQTLGHLNEAVRLQKQGFKLLDQLHRRLVNHATYAKSLADANSCLGELQFNLGNVGAAREAHETSRELLQELLQNDPANSTYQRGLAVAHNFLGTIYLRQGELQSARESYRASLTLRELLAGESVNQDNLEARLDLAIGLRRFGDILLKQAHFKQAGCYYERSLEVIAQAAAADPDHRVVQQQLAASHNKLGELALRTGQPLRAKQHFEQVERVDAELVRRFPDSFFDQMDLAAAKQQLGDVFHMIGDLESTGRLFHEALVILDGLQVHGSDSNLVMENVAATCLRLGDYHQRCGDSQAATQYYKRELQVERELATRDNTDRTHQRGVAVALGRLGDLKLQGLELDDALAFYQESLEIARRLATAAADDDEAQRDLFVSLARVAKTHQALGEPELAGDVFVQAVSIAKRRAASNSSDAQAQEDLASAYTGLAESRQFAGDNAAAREALRESLSIRERLAGQLENAEATYKLSLSLEKLFDLHWSLGEIELARPLIKNCLEIRERLADRSQDDARLMRARMVAMDRQAWVHEADGNLATARGLYERGVEVLERMLAIDPSAAQTRIDLVGLTWRLGYAYQRQFEFDEGRSRFERGLGALRQLAADGILAQHPELQPYVQHFEDHIEVCTFYDRVASDLAYALAQDEQRVGYLLYERSQILARRAQYDDAEATLETLATLDPLCSENLYSAACGYGLCVLALDDQSTSRPLTGVEGSLRRRFTTRAIELLDAAALHGYFLTPENAEWLLEDPDFGALRHEFDFQRFVRSND